MSDGKKRMMKVCVGCGETYEANYPEQRYCTHICYNKHRNDEMLQGICEECGTVYRKNTGKQRFCSRACSNAYVSRNRSKRGKKPNIQELVCEYCGKPFQAKYVRSFCSDACRLASRRRSDLERFGTAICPVCKREFVKKNKKQAFCSKGCTSAYKRIEYAASMEREHVKIRIRVLKDIPVYPYLRPAVGSIWEATEFLLLGGVKECYIETHGKQVILRKGEYERLA